MTTGKTIALSRWTFYLLYVYMCIYAYVCVYIYKEREREREVLVMIELNNACRRLSWMGVRTTGEGEQPCGPALPGLRKASPALSQVLSHNLYTVLHIPHDPVALEEHFRDDDDGPVSSQGYMPYLNKYILDKVRAPFTSFHFPPWPAP